MVFAVMGESMWSKLGEVEANEVFELAMRGCSLNEKVGVTGE